VGPSNQIEATLRRTPEISRQSQPKLESSSQPVSHPESIGYVPLTEVPSGVSVSPRQVVLLLRIGEQESSRSRYAGSYLLYTHAQHRERPSF